MSPIQPYPPMQPPYRSPRDGPANGLVSLPPLRQLSKTPPTPSDRRHANPFGVHSMLNPQAEMIEHVGDRRRSGSHMQSPSPIETHHSQPLPSISRPPSVDSTQSVQDEQNRPRLFQPPDRPSMRHIMVPRSPRLHRTQSLNVLNPPTGTIDAHQSPFLTASAISSEAANSHPALPTPPIAAGRITYFSTAPHSASTPPININRSEIRRPSLNFPQSGSASPITQYSPYSQAASVASSQYDSHGTQDQYGSGSGHAQANGSRHGSIPMETERNSMITMAPSSQSSIQLMTIKSQHGHNVQIPVDVQAASKVADEKRRRNAGASARFRARRKEKEREASISISRLEQSVRDSTEDAEYYRTERDYWKSIALQQQPDRHCTRPSSPRLTRVSAAPSLARSSTTGPGSEASYDDYDDEPREEERNVRRRTSSYHPVSGPPPADASAAGPDYAHGYPVAGFSLSNHPSGHDTSHEFRSVQHQQGHLRQPTPERPMYRDPFSAATVRYENRGWSPDPSRGRKH